MKHLNKHLSVANVLSCTALFVALSGVAYAASQLERKSVKKQHIANGAVTTPKLRKGAVTTRKLRNNAVSTAKLRNDAVTGGKVALGAIGSFQLADGGVRSRDLGGGVVTEGKLKSGAVSEAKLGGAAVTESKLAAGSVSTGKLQDGAVTAAKVATGFDAQLVKNVSYATKASGITPIDYEKLTADCPAGKQVIGGGARVVGETKKVALIESTPAVDEAGKRVGWTAAATEFAEEAADWTLEVHAICAEL